MTNAFEYDKGGGVKSSLRISVNQQNIRREDVKIMIESRMCNQDMWTKNLLSKLRKNCPVMCRI